MGELRITVGSKIERFFLEGGFVQVRDQLVTVLCEHATALDALDLNEAEAAAERARAEKSSKAADLAYRASVVRRVTSRDRPAAH